MQKCFHFLLLEGGFQVDLNVTGLSILSFRSQTSATNVLASGEHHPTYGVVKFTEKHNIQGGM